MFPWKTPSQEMPFEGALCIVIVNYKIFPDILVFRHKDFCFHSGSIAYTSNEIQYYIYKNDLPYPPFIADLMRTRDNEGDESILISAAYRQDKGDLFGNIIDPDDVRSAHAFTD